MADREYVMLEDKNGKEVLPVTDGNGVFVEGGTKKLDKKLTEINEQLEQLNLNSGISVNVKKEILKEKKENLLREKLGILAQVEIMKQSEMLRNTVELTNLKQSENNYIGSINNLINIIDTLLEGGENNG